MGVKCRECQRSGEAASWSRDGVSADRRDGYPDQWWTGGLDGYSAKHQGKRLLQSSDNESSYHTYHDLRVEDWLLGSVE